MAWFFAIATFFSTAAGGLVAIHRRKDLHLVMGAAAGLLVGAALFDLLPEATELARGEPLGVPIAAAGGFGVFLVLDRLVHMGAARHQAEGATRALGSITALGLTVHSFLDGVAIGSAFRVDARIGVLVGFVVVAHDFGDGVSTVGVVLGSRGAVRASLAWLLADAAAPMAGALLALSLRLPVAVLANLLAFFAGSFLFVGGTHLLPEAVQAGRPLRVGAAFLAGLTLSGAATWLSSR